MKLFCPSRDKNSENQQVLSPLSEIAKQRKSTKINSTFTRYLFSPIIITRSLLRNISAQQALQVWDEFFRIQEIRPMYHSAVRMSVSTAIVLSISMTAGHIEFGKIAVIGTLISGYGFGQSLSRRLRIQIAMAISMTIIVTLGSMTHGNRWLGLIFITVVTTIASFCCLAFSVGPPGAYLLCLCAGVSTNLSLHPTTLAAVATGGLVTITVTIVYSFFVKYRIQIDEFFRARNTISDYCQSVICGDPVVIHENRNAALAALVTNSSLLESTKGQLKRNPQRRELFNLNIVLQEVFIDFLLHELAIRQQQLADLQQIAQQVRTLRLCENPHSYVFYDNKAPERTFIATRAQWYERIKASFAIYTFARRTALRVFCASLITGMIVFDNHDPHSYWAIAAAVAILHQGPATRLIATVRSIQRTVGTLCGVLLAALIVHLNPQGANLILLLMLLQILIELTVLRNIALASIFVMPTAMLITTLGERTHETAMHIIYQRSYDTIIGCTVGMIIAIFATTLLTKEYLWIQLHDLIHKAHKFVHTAIPTRINSSYSSNPLSHVDNYHTQISELLHLRLRLDQMVVLAPAAWNDPGTRLAIQTARNLADLALIGHTIAREKTDSGITIKVHIENIYQEYWLEENHERIIEENLNG